MSLTDTALKVTWGEVLNPQFASSLLLVCFAVWLHAADSLLVATMIPAIVADIGGVNLIAWATALYQIGSIVAGAASGLLVNRYGVRYPMLGGALLYGLGCALSALAPEMWVMLAGRQLQGLGGGALIAISFVSVSLLFPARLVPRTLAAVSFIWGTSAFLGPLVGGLFVEYSNWRHGFWFFTLQSLALFVWVLMRREGQFNQPYGENGRFPFSRLACLLFGVMLIAWAGIEVKLATTLSLLTLGLGCLLMFLKMDGRREQDRLLPKHPIGFGNRVSAGLTMILCFTVATIAISVYGPFLMILVHDVSALAAGYVVACSSIGWSIAAVLVSGYDQRRDPQVILIGMGVLVVSVLGFVYSVAAGPVWLIAVFALLEGAGFGMSWSFILRRMTALATAGEQSRVAAAMPTVQRFGYACGAAYIGIVANAVGIDRISEETALATVVRIIFLACVPFALLGFAAAVRFVSPQAARTG